MTALEQLRRAQAETLRVDVECVLADLPPETHGQLTAIGGLRWRTDGYVFHLPSTLPDVVLAVSPIVGAGGAGGRLEFLVERELFAPEVYDFTRLGDAVVAAVDVCLGQLIKPRTAHRWCRRCTYGQEPFSRPQFYGPSDLPYVRVPLPGPGEIQIEDEDELA